MRVLAMRRILYLFLSPFTILLAAAQQFSLPAVFVANISSTLSTEWNTNVTALCSRAATSAITVDNPTGLLACYNVAALESVTGLFAADLRLYGASPSAVPLGSQVQINLDFGKAGTIQILTDTSSAQSTSQGTRRKRDSSIDLELDDVSEAHQKRQNAPLNPSVTVQPGSIAGVAGPKAGIKAILASPVKLLAQQNSNPPAVLPGERSLIQSVNTQFASQDAQIQARNQALAKQQASTSTTAASTSTTGLVQTSLGQISAGQEVEVMQFVGRLDVVLADSNPNGLGVAGSLLPKISLLLTVPNAANQVIDMSTSTRAYLTGVKGSLVPVNTFILPGRILLGQDHSVDKAGLVVVGIWVVTFLVVKSGGLITRWRMRMQYREHSKAVGRT